MSLRRSGVDAAAAELARRRLSLLGAELASVPPDRGVPIIVAGAASVAASVAGRVTGPEGDPAVGPVVGPVTGAPAVGAGAATARRGGRHAADRLGLARRLLLRAADGLPPGVHGRFRVTAQHVTVVALTLAAATALAAWLLVRSAPAEVVRSRQASLVLPSPRPSATPPAGPAAPLVVPPAAPVADTAAATAPSAVAPLGQRLLVHVAGKVRNPGVVELPAGARVVDALEAAGGALPDARLGALNLARPLVDGEQVAVGVPLAGVPVSVPAAPSTGVAPSLSAMSGTAPAGLVNLNTATPAQLEELPGVGPVTAASIIEWRTQHGGFSSVDELIEVSGIGEVTLAELRDLVTV